MSLLWPRVYWPSKGLDAVCAILGSVVLLSFLKDWKYLVVLVIVALLFVNGHHASKHYSQIPSGSEALNTIQEATEHAAQEMQEQRYRAHKASVLPRAENGVITFFFYNLLKPFIEARIDVYMAKIGLDVALRNYDNGAKGLIFSDISVGNGDALMCGQMVDIALHSDAVIASGLALMPIVANDNMTIMIGGGSVSRGVELSILGMKEEGARNVKVPRTLRLNRNFIPSHFDPGIYSDYTVRVKKVHDAYPQSAHSFFKIDSLKSLEREALCGDMVAVAIRLFDEDGNIRYNSSDHVEYLDMRLGSKHAPLGIELSILGMRRGGKRFVLLPADLLLPGNFNSKLYKDMNFSTSKATMMEIELLDVSPL